MHCVDPARRTLGLSERGVDAWLGENDWTGRLRVPIDPR